MSTGDSTSVEVFYGDCDDLTRPILKQAYAWTQERLSENGMLDRYHVRPQFLAPFIQHASFYKFLVEDGKVVDFQAKVLASQIADNVVEISGKWGKAHLPAPLFERWLTACNHTYRLKAPFSTRSQVFGKEHKRAESLSIPVTDRGSLTHALVFSEYWVI